MRVVVVYESMHGSTEQVARAVADELRGRHEVTLVGVDEVDAHRLPAADLLVVGGPTHAHGMSRQHSRKSAQDQADAVPLTGTGVGVRELLEDLPVVHGLRAAAFDTRIDKPELLTGAASHGIGKRLRSRGYDLVTEPESFLVHSKGGHESLVDGELARAATWAAELERRVPVG
ncbi:MAG: flavodoxin family protein [Motilibacteraceae bacterium]